MTEAPPAPDPVEQRTRPTGTRRRFAWRWTRRLLTVVVAVVAAAFVSFFSIDLGRVGPLRELAEREASKFLERPMHIGRLSALIRPGEFALDDVVIEGPTPSDRPFFRAKRITVYFPWWTLFRNQIELDVRLTGWQMAVETWPTGTRIPNFRPKTQRIGRSRFTTTVKFVYANDGEFIYDDHVTPWRIVGRNLNFQLVRAENLDAYVGKAAFDDGMVQIQNYLPMSAKFSTRFVLDPPRVQLQHIDLLTDGAESHVSGYVNFGNWPDQEYAVSSTVNLPRMREIFFANESWRLTGNAGFKGSFKLFKGGRDLSGQFTSEAVTVNDWPFYDLHGALVWQPSRFVVTHADSVFLGGDLRFTYGIEPLGTRQGATARVTAEYDDVDLRAFTGSPNINWTALDPDGRMGGRLVMAWPNGRFSSGLQGEGETTITPAAGARMATLQLPAQASVVPAEAPFDPYRPLDTFPLAVRTKYRFTSESLDFEESFAATPSTYVAFRGHAVGDAVNLPFHVTSHDWQESDRLFAAIMEQFGSSPGAIEVGGRGTFDGTLTESFRAPRIEGKFLSDQMRAWDVVWGRAQGDLVIQNGFLDIRSGLITGAPGSAIRTDGRYSLGYKPGVDEMNARVTVENWPLADLSKAFGLEDWPVDGGVQQADLQLRGPYRELRGTGTVRLDRVTAWKEPFDYATGELAFEGDGMRVRRLEMPKSTGLVTGSAWIGWDGTYSFSADGTRIPVESLSNFTFARAPLTGTLQFKASGAGKFASPSYEFDGSIADLYVGDEGLGQVRGKLVVRDNVLTFDGLEAISSRLRVLGSGSIGLTDRSDANFVVRFFETSIDPYLKLFAPEISPYTRAIATGVITVVGPLADWSQLVVDAKIENQRATLTLLDYELRNQGDIHLTLEDNVFKIGRLILAGQDTNLDLGGSIDIGNKRVDLDADGQANLAILQLFYPELSTFGAASLQATLQGAFGKLALNGEANLHDGRLRHQALPHGLSEINGPIRIDSDRISIDGLRGVMGEGAVTFGGYISLRDGYRPEEYRLTADGLSMNLRYPQGLHSTVDAHLRLEGAVTSPVLRGRVDVLRAQYRPRIDRETGLFGLAGGATLGTGAVATGVAPPVAGTTSGIPLGLAIDVIAPVLPFIATETATIEGSAEVHIEGTIDRPIVTGRMNIERGQFFFNGNRYVVRNGSIDFTNPLKFEPFFDLEAETRTRAAGQTFRVDVRVTGTVDKLSATFNSDPWLPEFQVISLLLGELPAVAADELREGRSAQELQAQAVRTAAFTLLASPITSTVGSVFERAPLVDTFQIVPLLGNEATLQQSSPTARVILGTRISDRAYLTYSRTLSGQQNEIIVIEYDQSDRISWVLSRNEDRSFALDFRIRHVF